MNSHRAKLLRRMAKYNMEEERSEGERLYNFVYMSPDKNKHDHNHVSVICKGPRALYKLLKKRYYERRHRERY